MTVKFERCLLPPGQDEGAHDDPVVADRWKNLVFRKDGSTILAREIHPSDRQAKELSDSWEAAMSRVTADGTLLDIIDPSTGTFLFVFPTGYSHTIQIPWNLP